jgi:hypothetical protein
MGSPVSGIVAEAVMQRLERIALPLIRPTLWIRYVDDTFVIIKRSELEEAYRLLNCVFLAIQFTREEEDNGQLPFLDVNVTRTDTGELQTSVYRKPTHTDQVLHFKSNHPVAHKRSCVQTLFRRARTHCSTAQLLTTEEKHIFDLLLKNSYPKNFIRRCRNSQNQHRTEETDVKRLALPYINGISEMTARTLRPFGIAIAHKPTTTLRSLLTKTKDRTTKEEKRNIVYRIPCRGCSKHYVGQTGRKLGTRIHEHQLAARRHDQKSLLSIHADREGHEIDWENTEILATASSRHAREFLEAWHSTEQSINQHVQLDTVYGSIRSRLRRMMTSTD